MKIMSAFSRAFQSQHVTSRSPHPGNLEDKKPGARSGAAAAKAATRARSYERLRGFSRIGGVLIGREPANAEIGLEIDHFSWNRSGGQIELVVGKDSNRQSLGQFHPAIVQLALAYAADGRPTTVTMVTTGVVPDFRILLHPALEDTGLGCRAIRLDQLAAELFFVEGSARANMRSNAEQRIRGEIGLYRIAWQARAKAKRKPDFLDPSLVAQMEKCLPSNSLSHKSEPKRVDSSMAQTTRPDRDPTLHENCRAC